MGFPLKKIHGDSLVIINWAIGKSVLSSIDLDHWCVKNGNLIRFSTGVDINHVYGEQKQITDCLSKDALLLDPGHCVFSKY